MQKTIYDVGANRGYNIPYYLLKADKVVAVEANPVLCEGIRQSFRSEIEQGRLVVIENVVITKVEAEPVYFYIHKQSNTLSQFPEPAPEDSHLFERVLLPARDIVGIIREHGDPWYVKVDVEHFDAAILRSMFEGGIFPPYISAEAHSAKIFAELVAVGGYDAFKIVDGPSLFGVYENRTVETVGGERRSVSFAYPSAGPFGNDVDGNWISADNLVRALVVEGGFGWKDIHASRVDKPDINEMGRMNCMVPGLIRRHIRKTRHPFRAK